MMKSSMSELDYQKAKKHFYKFLKKHTRNVLVGGGKVVVVYTSEGEYVESLSLTDCIAKYKLSTYGINQLRYKGGYGNRRVYGLNYKSKFSFKLQ